MPMIHKKQMQEMYDSLMREARDDLATARANREFHERRCKTEIARINYLKSLALKDGLEP